jgi:putative peptidoglycan lipid II flippase
VLMRSYVTPFLARGDTTTPVVAALIAVAVNVALKILLVGRFAQVGLALATSAGAWINLALLIYWARLRNFESPGVSAERTLRLLVAGGILATALFLGERFLRPLFAGITALREESLLLCLLLAGGALYLALIVAVMGRAWLGELMRDTGGPAVRPGRGEAD